MSTIRDAVKRAGFCCPWAFFYQARRIRTLELCELLGVDDSTVRRWRREVRRGEHKCAGAKKCLLITPWPKR